VAKLLIGAPDLDGGLGSFGLIDLVGVVGHHGVAPGGLRGYPRRSRVGRRAMPGTRRSGGIRQL
jgi:hypothetical protein